MASRLGEHTGKSPDELEPMLIDGALDEYQDSLPRGVGELTYIPSHERGMARQRLGISHTF